MDSKTEKCQEEMQNALDMLEVSNAVIANLELRTMRTEDKPMQEIQDLQEETQTDDSLVTQDSDPPESLRKSQDVQAAWNHESHYASNEIQGVNDPRPARKKEEAARKSFLSHKASQNRKHRNRLLADADARLASKGKQAFRVPKIYQAESAIILCAY